MAGKYIEFLNPGYSTLYTRDLQYALNTDSTYGPESGNVFDPDSNFALIEGEWLSYAADNKVSRFGSQTQAAGYNVSTLPCALLFSEKGRYDAQITKKCHLVSGPNGFDFKTKLCKVDSGASVGDRLFVTDVAVGSSFKKGLSDATSIQADSGSAFRLDIDDAKNMAYYWSPGYIQRVISTSEVVVHFDPQLLIVRIEA